MNIILHMRMLLFGHNFFNWIFGLIQTILDAQLNSSPAGDERESLDKMVYLRRLAFWRWRNIRESHKISTIFYSLHRRRSGREETPHVLDFFCATIIPWWKRRTRSVWRKLVFYCVAFIERKYYIDSIAWLWRRWHCSHLMTTPKEWNGNKML